MTITTQTSHMLPIHTLLPQASRLIMGCMGLGGGWNAEPISAADEHLAFSVIDTALESGINFFDHADIYTFNKAEAVFGRYLKQFPAQRQQLYIQSKCAIKLAQPGQTGQYDCSKQYILDAVNGTLARLETDYLDLLLLHRPDPLMQAEEVAAAFDLLTQQGKVRHFGVSNMGWAQMQLLQSQLSQPLRVNQLEMSLAAHHWLEEGVLIGMPAGAERHFGYGTLEYCQLNKVQLQSWGSLAQGRFSPGFAGQNHTEQAVSQLLQRLAAEYQSSSEAILLAWLMRHPAAIQPVIGSSNLQRIQACAAAPTIVLSREHWYQLYVAARGAALP